MHVPDMFSSTRTIFIKVGGHHLREQHKKAKRSTRTHLKAYLMSMPQSFWIHWSIFAGKSLVTEILVAVNDRIDRRIFFLISNNHKNQNSKVRKMIRALFPFR